MGKYCDHDFFNIKLDVDYNPSTLAPLNSSAHAVVGCIYCGQIRKIYTNGRIIIEVDEGIIERKRNANATSNSNNRTN